MLMLALSLSSAAMGCRVENAHYVLRSKPDVRARFARVSESPDWPSGVAFVIDYGATGRRDWWLPWNGGTDGLQHLASTKPVDVPGWRPPSPDGGPRPNGDLDYIAADAAYDIIDTPPRRTAVAPQHILLPRLGDVTRHPGTEGSPRVNVPKAFFDLDRCAGTD